ncbi:MerR family transcriptional regulator [Oligella urethralis]|uniref:MerR family transcriptional regulator n=1 Tax=Oligella urethralis DNF00040 TaxID=1401065 RepID=A0A095ZAK7_9BURK|nr:MerR family DNA-binding transcriptional regulator [Oligella urethralis]AVL72005.1 MerR family DNA-binding transcriptional regulator [Oligella urethralis]KGF31698.1 MerR family transcriptional regulator [Oligella urethralis DNF00040]PMC19190.1 MerR family DNA-binding transcriptional regulator [Oligella urethralis]SUA64773.1 Zn(II)-responsive regulator of zntA [Oligella urethralis]
MTQELWSISELAEIYQVTPRTLRYYEDQGIISPQRDGQKRIYNHRDRTRLKLALRGKRLGFSLAEIRNLIDMYDGPNSHPGQLQSYLSHLKKQKELLIRQQKDIQEVLEEIDRQEQICFDLLAKQSK